MQTIVGVLSTEFNQRSVSKLLQSRKSKNLSKMFSKVVSAALRRFDREKWLKIFSQIVAVFACVAVVNCGLVPAAVPAAYAISPYASTYNAHTSKWLKVIRLVQLLKFYSTCSQPRCRHSICFRTSSQNHFALRSSRPLRIIALCGFTLRSSLRGFSLLLAVLIALCIFAICLPKQLLPLSTSPSCTTFINDSPVINKNFWNNRKKNGFWFSWTNK